MALSVDRLQQVLDPGRLKKEGAKIGRKADRIRENYRNGSPFPKGQQIQEFIGDSGNHIEIQTNSADTNLFPVIWWRKVGTVILPSGHIRFREEIAVIDTPEPGKKAAEPSFRSFVVINRSEDNLDAVKRIKLQLRSLSTSGS